MQKSKQFGRNGLKVARYKNSQNKFDLSKNMAARGVVGFTNMPE